MNKFKPFTTVKENSRKDIVVHVGCDCVRCREKRIKDKQSGMNKVKSIR